MPIISIIVPVYNVEPYIAQCLESLVNQTLQDIEIIIIDDGSPDNSAAIYNAFAKKDSRIKCVKKANGGVSAARNDGLALATGDFVMFVDPDDWMEQNACELLYDEYLRTGADLIVADVFTVKGDKKSRVRVFKEAFTTEDRDFIRQYEIACVGYGYNPLPASRWNIAGLGSPWNKLFKRDIIVKADLKFDSYVQGIYDDNLFSLYYLVNCKKISYIPTPMYNYRIIATSLTQGYKASTLDTNERIFQRIHDFVRQQEADYAADFEKAFYIYVIRRLDASLGVYFFSQKNKLSLHKKCKELGKTIKSQPYATAIAMVEPDRLIWKTHKITRTLAHINSPMAIWLSFWLRNAVKGLLR